MPGRSNNRRNLRVFCGAPARAEGPRGPLRGTCRNLSVGGLFFVGPTLPVGQSIQLRIDLPESGAVEVTGEVRYHHSYDEGVGMGIRFTRLGQEDLTRVSRFVDAHA